MAIVNPNLFSFCLVSPGLEYPTLKTHADGSFAEDACAGSRAKCVFLNLKTSRSPETLAGGPYTRDAIVGSSVVNVIPPIARALVENMFPFMRLNTTCINDANHLFGARGRFSWSSPMDSFSRWLLQLLVPIDACYIVFVVAVSSTCLLVYYCSLLVLFAIYCWFVLGLVPSGQDLEAFCLVDVVFYCCFIQSSLLRSLKLDISFVLGVTTLYSLICSASSFMKWQPILMHGVLLACFCCVAIFAIKELDGACSGGTFVTSVDAATPLLWSSSIRLSCYCMGCGLVARAIMLPSYVCCKFVHFYNYTAGCGLPLVALELTSVLLEAAGGLELQTGYSFFCLFFHNFGENVGLLLSPCSEADFMVHRGALCCYAHMWDRLYFGICVLVLCCSKGYVRLLGLNKLVASSWSLSYGFCYRLRVMLVMLVFCSFC
ncbi:hypothetical protein POTOM_032476 [Populus tomentosa]|uniref:Uncharacterized protein n=1 Tax=Populus tomentosa TaxID=118781 RepID=A0A8X8CPU9_POPTO|nr:hypothetical protein POTOM_032476 [Populus tomentosa]